MTSLIDVIFLLLLFFMLSSTFSRFAEVELQAAAAGGSQLEKPKFAFLRAGPTGLSLNGAPVTLVTLDKRVRSLHEVSPIVLLVNVSDAVTAQQMTDILVIVRDIPDLTVSVMGAG
jgi:biopolymer transport protein ExbD